MADTVSEDLARIIKQRRRSIPLTLAELSAKSGISEAYLSRIELAARFPSANVLRKIARPLGFEEDKLFMLAGYLTPVSTIKAENRKGYDEYMGLDPYVASVLAQEPIEMQRATAQILSILKSLAHALQKNG